MATAPPLLLTARYASPCGELILGSIGPKLCLCDWAARTARLRPIDRICRTIGVASAAVGAEIEGGIETSEGVPPIIEEACRQLDEYFARRRREFTLPLLPVGTEFQRRVWSALLRVPFGAVRSYGTLAQSLGAPTATRAVAAAVGANALSILIPCHRIVGASGALTGYAGGLDAKRFLLRLEAIDEARPEH